MKRCKMIGISKTEGPFRIYTDRRSDKRRWVIDLARLADHLYICFVGSPTFIYGYLKLRGSLNIPSLGHKIIEESITLSAGNTVKQSHQ